MFTCRTEKVLQEGQPLSTAVFKTGGELGQSFQRRSSEEEGEARDPSPNVEARQDFWSIMGDDVYRNHVAPGTKLYVPTDDFPVPLNHIDVQRDTQKQDLMFFKRRLQPWLGQACQNAVSAKP